MSTRVRAQSDGGQAQDLEDGLSSGQRRLAERLHDVRDQDLEQLPRESRSEPGSAACHGIPHGVTDHRVRGCDWSDGCRCGGEDSAQEMEPQPTMESGSIPTGELLERPFDSILRGRGDLVVECARDGS
jgi:hypothetical protein